MAIKEKAEGKRRGKLEKNTEKMGGKEKVEKKDRQKEKRK